MTIFERALETVTDHSHGTVVRREEEMSRPILWKRYQEYLCRVPELGLTLDISRMRFEDGFLERMAASRPATTCTASCSARGRLSSRTTASP